PEPFVIKIRRCPIREGCVSDKAIKAKWGTYYGDTNSNSSIRASLEVVSPISPQDNKEENKRNNLKKNENTHPPSPRSAENKESSASVTIPPGNKLNREETRFLSDIAKRPLLTTVLRYQRLNLSRRRGNAIRQSLANAGIIKAVTIATRSGQVVLYQLTDMGRSVCSAAHIETCPKPRESLEHRYWVKKTCLYFRQKGFEIKREHPVKGNGAIDILATRPGEVIAIEVETGKSDIKANLEKIKDAGFDKIIFVSTNPSAVGKCQKAIDSVERSDSSPLEQLSWLDIT
ncbi:MAG: hypothetical protein GY845_29290, partial [Planctomycetes bacterium]|nr:hypothetical protein [Planctomycetota bacterium]